MWRLHKYRHFQTPILSPLIISQDKKVDGYFFTWWQNNSLKSYMFWRSSSLKFIFISTFCARFGPPGSQTGLKLKNLVFINKIYSILKNWSFCMMFKIFCKKNIEFWETLNQTSVKCSQGICVNFGDSIASYSKLCQWHKSFYHKSTLYSYFLRFRYIRVHKLYEC